MIVEFYLISICTQYIQFSVLVFSDGNFFILFLLVITI